MDISAYLAARSGPGVMSIGFSEKERAFVDGLAADTGRDLDGWMTAIAGAGLTQRNEIIDWLRQEGFTFARASWIERIHHNGGKLIYAGGVRTPAERHTRKPVKPGADVRPMAVKAPTPAAPTQAVAAQSGGDVEALLAAAKAYRPLAQVLLRDILSAVPGADVRALSGHVVVSQVRPFAAIVPGPKDVRLLLSFGPRPSPPPWVRVKTLPGLDSLAGLTHMIVLTDARQLNWELKELVSASARDAVS